MRTAEALQGEQFASCDGVRDESAGAAAAALGLDASSTIPPITMVRAPDCVRLFGLLGKARAWYPMSRGAKAREPST